jgi:hypothetical protein
MSYSPLSLTRVVASTPRTIPLSRRRDPLRFGTVWAASYFGIRGNLGRGLVEAAGGDRLHLRLSAGGTLIPRLRPGSGRHMIPSEHASHSRKLLYDLHCFLSSDRNLVAYG